MIVLNDDHNTFDHVAHTLSSVIPGVTLDGGYRFADKIHNSGKAAVWTGPREAATRPPSVGRGGRSPKRLTAGGRLWLRSCGEAAVSAASRCP